MKKGTSGSKVYNFRLLPKEIEVFESARTKIDSAHLVDIDERLFIKNAIRYYCMKIFKKSSEELCPIKWKIDDLHLEIRDGKFRFKKQTSKIISNEPIYPKEFNNKLKEQIKKRDNFRCLLCGEHSIKLDVHHIDYNKDNLRINNLCYLCSSCHGKTNTKRDYWKSYLDNLVNNFKSKHQLLISDFIKLKKEDDNAS